MESHAAISTGVLWELSPQQIVSCAPNPNDCGGTGGCGGSIPELVFDYVAKVGLLARRVGFLCCPCARLLSPPCLCILHIYKSPPPPSVGIQNGLTSAFQYGYGSYFGTSPACPFGNSSSPSPIRPVIKINGHVKLPENLAGVEALYRALAFVGPVATNVQAAVWQHYEVVCDPPSGLWMWCRGRVSRLLMNGKLLSVVCMYGTCFFFLEWNLRRLQ